MKLQSMKTDKRNKVGGSKQKPKHKYSDRDKLFFYVHYNKHEIGELTLDSGVRSRLFVLFTELHPQTKDPGYKIILLR